jgi:ring-1,2-phenylacetyl-CoA epoxidase subunit PaaD
MRVGKNLYNMSQAIRNLLSQIPDPEIPVISLEELGIIRDIEETDGGVKVTVTPTYSGCPAVSQIMSDIKSLLELNGYNNVSVVLNYSPAWSTRMMYPSAFVKLKEYGIAPPQHCCGNELCLSGKCSKVICPKCSGRETTLVSEFSSTACKSLYTCAVCMEPFEYFKPLE